MAISVLTAFLINLAITAAASIASFLLTPGPEDSEGPRLDDLTVTKSKFGVPIPLGFGTIRQAGMMIWAGELLETVHTKRVGGSGKKQKITSYTYSQSFAIAFGEGEAEDVLQLYFDGKLVYDVTGTSVDVAKEGLDFTFHRGTETQEPDDTISSFAHTLLADETFKMSFFLPSADASQGTGYVVGDVLTMVGGTFTTAAQVTVTAIGGGGEITLASITNGGVYTLAPDMPAAMTGGTGSGATFALVGEFLAVDLTPGYRGLVYIVFKDLQLEDYGNRKPNVEAVVAYKGTAVTSVEEATPIVGGLGVQNDPNAWAMDFKRSRAYFFDTVGDVDNQGIRRFNARAMIEDRQLTANQALSQSVVSKFRDSKAVVMDDGAVVVQLTTTGTNGDLIARLDPNSLVETARDGVPTSTLTFAPGKYPSYDEAAAVTLIGPLGKENFILMKSLLDRDFGVASVTPSSINWVWGARDSGEFDTTRKALACCGGLIGDGIGEGFTLSGPNYLTGPKTGAVRLYRLRVTAGSAFDALTGKSAGVEHVPVAWMTPQFLTESSEDTLTTAGHGMAYDPIDDSVIFHVKADGTSQDYIVKVALTVTPGTISQFPTGQPSTEASIVWVSKVAEGPLSDGRHLSDGRLRGTTYAYMVDDKAYVIDARTGEVRVDGQVFSAGHAGAGSTGAYDAQAGIWYGHIDTGNVLGRWFLDRRSGQSAPVSDVVTTVCGKVGLEPADLDVSALTAHNIEGFIIARKTTARSALEPLANIFFFEGVESDSKLKFVERGGASARTILQRDLAELDAETGEFFRENRAQEVELPEHASVQYLDKDNSYQTGTQSARRIRVPTPASFSQNSIRFEIAAVLDASFAKQMVEKALYSAWIGRSNFETLLPWTHLDLEPTDVVTLLLDSGDSFRTRINSFNMGVGYQIEAGLVQEVEDQYTSTAVADAGTGPTPQEVPSSGSTRLILLDTPLLRDSDEAPGRAFSSFYFFAGGFGQPGWHAATLFDSDDGADYTQGGRITTEMIWGTAAAALGDPPLNNPWILDTVNTLTVALATDGDSLASVSESQMLRGANAAAIIKTNGEVEIIQFQNFVDNGDGTITLSTLLRGRRGTDTMAFGHTAGETFLILDVSHGDITTIDISRLGVLRYYKAVGTNQFLEEADVEVLTALGRSLVPYSSVNQKATKSGSDVVLTWVRRTRVGGSLGVPQSSFGGPVPLSEDSEAYEIEILDAPGGSIVRTVTSLTSPTYTYTAAQQVTDGFTAPVATIDIKVYQISGESIPNGGRGFSREANLSVVG